MNSHDIVVLLKLSLRDEPRIQSKELADTLFISASEISKALRRCQASGLLYWSDLEKRVNRPALLEFLTHGMRFVFPAQRGSLVRGIPTAAAMEPLKSRLIADGEPPPVWPFSEGSLRGIAFEPLYKNAPKAALRDESLYRVMALCDAIRGGRTRERNLAIDLLQEELHA